MADDVGMQCALHLLLDLSDDDLKTPNWLAIDTLNEYKASVSSNSSFSDRKARVKFSSQQRLIMGKIQEENKRLSISWFKKFLNILINVIDQVLNDYSSSCNTIRISILLLSNLYYISKTISKNFMKKRLTYQKLLTFFDKERDNLTNKELIELEKSF
jgi:hypothetical protein